MSANEKPFVPSITTSTLGDRLEALRVTQQGYEDELPARLRALLAAGPAGGQRPGVSGTARKRERDQLMPIHQLVDGGRDVGPLRT